MSERMNWFWVSFNLQKEADRIIRNKYAPAAVITKQRSEIIQFPGRY